MTHQNQTLHISYKDDAQRFFEGYTNCFHVQQVSLKFVILRRYSKY